MRNPYSSSRFFSALLTLGCAAYSCFAAADTDPPFHDGYQIPQFRNIHEPLRVVCSRNCIVTISPRRCQAGENKPSQSAPLAPKPPGAI